MLAILIAVCEVARTSDYGLADELVDDIDSVVKRAQAEAASLGAEAPD
jgi:hypothetical protein